MDPNDYKAQVQAAVQAVQPVTAPTSVDTTADARTQAGQILLLGRTIVQDDALFTQMLQRLANTSENTEVRLAILRALETQRFAPARFQRRTADWTAALRGLMNDPDLEVRITALDSLVNIGDPQVQDQLVSALRTPGPTAIVSQVVALQLLGNDVHSEVFPLARQIVDNPPNADTKLAALRLLAADAGSVSLFTGLLANAQETSDVRIMALAALNSLAPDTLVSNASSLVRSGDSNPDVMAASLVALATTSRPLPQDIAQAVNSLATSQTGSVQLAALQVQNRLNPVA